MTAPTNQVSSNVLTAEERRRRYNKVVREARLVTIMLEGVEFNVDRVKFNKAEDPSLNFKGETSEPVLVPDRGACLVPVQWKVELKDGRKQVAKCNARYVIIYNGFTELEPEIMAIFADGVAKGATYSYFRSLFAQLDWAADLRTPPLPVLKVFPNV